MQGRDSEQPITAVQSLYSGVSCCRYSAVIDDNTVTHLNVEPDGSGLSCSLAGTVLKQLQES